MVPKTSSTILSVLVIAIALVCSCSTTRVLEEGQYRLAKNEVEITNDRKFNPKEVEKYIQQKSNTYLVFGWNPFLNVYNWSGRDTSKFSNKLIRKIGVAPVVYQPAQVDASIDNIKRHLEYLGYYHSDVKSDVKVDGRDVDVKYTVRELNMVKQKHSQMDGKSASGRVFMTMGLPVRFNPGDWDSAVFELTGN